MGSNDSLEARVRRLEDRQEILQSLIDCPPLRPCAGNIRYFRYFAR
jgi:hypothetical protein